eukprot:Opistho-2@13834
MSSRRCRFAFVCSSNQNRSMEAHLELSTRGFCVRSFGTGANVRLPGPSVDQPNVYPFTTSYRQIYDDLLHKDPQLYTQNGILDMVRRNINIKQNPERFQSCDDEFDVIITVEERVFDQVLENMEARPRRTSRAVHILNMDVKDNHEEAAVGAKLIAELAQQIESADDLEDSMEDILAAFQQRHGRELMHSVAFY